MPKVPEFDAAADTDTLTAAEDVAAPTLSQRAAGLAELVREHPRAAIAAGAAVAAGAAIAAAIPLARRARANGSGARATRRGAARKSPARGPQKS